MRFSTIQLLGFLASTKSVEGILNLLNIETTVTADLCGKQSNGIELNMTKMEGTECNGECYYKICMNVKKDPSLLDILLDPYNKLTHSCIKSDSICQEESKPGFLDVNVDAKLFNTDLVAGLKIGLTSQCQIVKSGTIAEFLLGYDEGECGTSVLDVVEDTLEFVANCGVLDVASCVGLNGVGLGTECVWRVQAPECTIPDDTNKETGGGGDPHFARWGRDRDTFHGECDLVLIHSENFHQGAGLDLYARTTMHSYYSYIETAALRVGEHIMEFHNDHLYFNGLRLSPQDLPATFGDNFKYTIGNVEIQDGKAKKNRQTYQVDLGDNSSILFMFYKEFLTFKISGHPVDFEDSVGLMGSYESGEMITRDGEVVNDFQQHAFEWQVHPTDKVLFREARQPQLPYESCRLPTAPRPARRQLRGNDSKLFEDAEKACAHVQGSSFDLCIDDIMMTQDVGLATAYW